MRTIKFRGKRRNCNEWVYGNFIRIAGRQEAFISNSYSATSSHAFVVKPETVGQFTGLFDKNGNEIYEGDIFRYDNPDSINEVSYCAGGGFAGFDLTPAIHSENRLLDVEVIGNIHDNPELLNQ